MKMRLKLYRLSEKGKNMRSETIILGSVADWNDGDGAKVTAIQGIRLDNCNAITYPPLILP